MTRQRSFSPSRLGRVAALCVAAAGLPGALAAPAAASAPASAVHARSAAHAASAPAGKDIVLDAPHAASAPARVVSPALLAVDDRSVAEALTELGLGLLRAQGREAGNAVVSPLSLASALGILHAGTQGPAAAELAGLFGTPATGTRVLATRLPGALARLDSADGAAGRFVAANRVWLDERVAGSVPAGFRAAITQRYRADAATLSFAKGDAARAAVNAWAAQRTGGRIPALLPPGATSAATRVVLTNAILFKSAWEQPFEASQTSPRPFHLADGTARPVPTMIDEREVRRATLDGVDVIELPFAGGEFVLVVAMPPAGQALDATVAGLAGDEVAAWRSQLAPQNCLLELPRFALAPAGRSLRRTLQGLGLAAVFGEHVDFAPMLGAAAAGVHVDDVFQSAMIVVDEQGGEAAAATAVTASAKSIAAPAPVCAVDRPFLFAVVHRATGLPLFIGKVADPAS